MDPAWELLLIVVALLVLVPISFFFAWLFCGLKGTVMDFSRSIALLCIAICRCADFLTNLYFLSFLGTQRPRPTFGPLVICLIFVVMVKCILSFAVTGLAYDKYAFPICIAKALLAGVGADGLILALENIRTSWGTDWSHFRLKPYVGDDSSNFANLLMACRLIEGLLECLPFAVAQAIMIRGRLVSGEYVDAILWWTVVASLLSVVFLSRGLIIEDALDDDGKVFRKSNFDGLVLWVFVICDVALRLATCVIALSSKMLASAFLSWWACLFFLFLASLSWQSWAHIREDVFCSEIHILPFRLSMYLGIFSLCFMLLISSPVSLMASRFFKLNTIILIPEHVCAFEFIRAFEFLIVGIVSSVYAFTEHIQADWFFLPILVVCLWPVFVIAKLRIRAVTCHSRDSLQPEFLKSSSLLNRLRYPGVSIDKACYQKCCGCSASRDAARSAFLQENVDEAETDTVTLESFRPPGWMAKAEELAYRGLELGKLLDFYAELGTPYLMPQFDATQSTTDDVVRMAIIPVSWQDRSLPADGKALASVLQGGPKLAVRLVSHTWTNLFANTFAAMLADALDEAFYDGILQKLHQRRFGLLQEQLLEKGVLQRPYWFCAVSVNQHANICASFADGTPDWKTRDTVTKEKYKFCKCPTKKYFNTWPDKEGALCEINKFDDMMRLMAHHVKRNGDTFTLVVAVDTEFALFWRIWCLAEMVVARKRGIAIKLKLPSLDCLKDKHSLTKLKAIRVQDCKATRREDVDAVLENIGDPDEFNKDLQTLFFDKQNGIFAEFLRTLPREFANLASEVTRALGAFFLVLARH